MWGHSRYTNKLFVLQKRAVRILAKTSLDPTTADIFYKDTCKTLFRHFKILTLPCVYILNVIMYVIRDGMSTKNADIHQHNTRGKTRYVLKIHRTNFVANGPQYAGNKFFNVLPNYIRCISDIQIFKCKLKDFLVHKCYYTIDEFLNDCMYS